MDESDIANQRLTARDMQEIPQEVRNTIPPCGQYLENIMQVCGYARKESIITLKEKHEMDKMFAFVKSMSDVIEEKQAVLGVVSKYSKKSCSCKD